MNGPARSADGRTSDFVLTDREMRKARLTPVIEVECKECDALVGYERNRGKAWEVFAQHAAGTHSDGRDHA